MQREDQWLVHGVKCQALSYSETSERLLSRRDWGPFPAAEKTTASVRLHLYKIIDGFGLAMCSTVERNRTLIGPSTVLP